ncbi:MAG: hypothetical protein JWM11_2725 [Planctomycetaceae bacterium]|nr:hypothetical protein [Planctomycetaceae bacterium]
MSIQGVSDKELGSLGRVGVLGLVAFATWLLLALPAYAVAGVRGLEGLTWSAAVCSLSGAPVVWVVSQIPVSPIRVWVVMAGMGVRMFAVAIIVLLFWKTRPDLGWPQFYCWLVVFYNIMLMAETYLALPGAENSNARP